MIHTGYKFQSRLVRFLCLAVCGIVALLGASNASAQQAAKVGIKKFNSEPQQPIYREYRGVRLNMTMDEARNKLGKAAFPGDELDYFIFSESETAQIAYNAEHRVKTISVDFKEGIGAPEYLTVVGAGLLQRPDGSLYKMIEYNAEGFWVSYNKSAGAAPIVTITLQLSR